MQLLDDTSLASSLKSSDRYYLVQQVTKEFWQRWASEVTPQYVLRQKWHENGRDLKINDVVLIHDASDFKGKYRLGIVETVNLGRDDRVRSCAVGYTLPRVKDPLGQYTGGRRILVTRSVQRLSLLLPVEEQSNKLEVVGFEVKMSDKGDNSNGQEVKKDKKSCENKNVEKSEEDKNIKQSCSDKINCHTVKDVNRALKEDLVAEGIRFTEDLAAEERTFLEKAQFKSTKGSLCRSFIQRRPDSGRFPSTEDLAAEERMFPID